MLEDKSRCNHELAAGFFVWWASDFEHSTNHQESAALPTELRALSVQHFAEAAIMHQIVSALGKSGNFSRNFALPSQPWPWRPRESSRSHEQVFARVVAAERIT